MGHRGFCARAGGASLSGTHLLGHVTKSAEAVLISMQCLLPLVCLVRGVPTLHMGVYCVFHLGGTGSGAKLHVTHQPHLTTLNYIGLLLLSPRVVTWLVT